MTTLHGDITVRAGDDWTIPGQLLNINGQPLDLTNATLEWVLWGPAGDLAIPSNVVDIDILAQSNVNVTVPRGVTRGLVPGYYTDGLRITVGETSDTLWTGPVAVSGDLFDFFAEAMIEFTSPAFQILQPAIGVPILAVA